MDSTYPGAGVRKPNSASTFHRAAQHGRFMGLTSYEDMPDHLHEYLRFFHDLGIEDVYLPKSARDRLAGESSAGGFRSAGARGPAPTGIGGD